MNLGELKEAVLEQFDGRYETDVIRHINKALTELAINSKQLKRDTISVSNGEANIPADCLIIKQVYHKNRRLEQYMGDNVPETQASKNPVNWLKDGNKITLIPALTSGDIQLVYTKKPDVLTNDNDTHDFDSADEYIIAHATWKTFVETQGVSNETIYWKNEAREELERWKELNNMQEQRPRKVRTRPFL